MNFFGMNDDDDQLLDVNAINGRLGELRQEHGDLDDAIRALAGGGTFNHLQLQRLKKRKLQIKDQIAKLESLLVPDIIA